MTQVTRRTLGFAALASPLLVAVSRAQPAPTLRMVLDWAPQPQQSPWFLAADRGHFGREGLTVAVDRGFGSGDALSKVASGTHDIGFGDVNSLVLWNHQNPNQRLVAVFLLMDRGQQAIMTLRGRGIARVQDLAGRRIGRTAGDIIGPLWPAFSRLHGIDSSRIEWIAVTPQLRDSLVWRGQVDAASGFASTSYFNLLALGARAEDVLLFPFADHGFDLFGNGLVVRAEYADRHGEVLRRFIRATIAGLRDALTDRAAAVAAVTRRDQMANATVEAARFDFILQRSILTADALRHGIGEVPRERLARVTGFLAEAYGIPAPSPESYFVTEFLPPQAERMVAG